MPSATLVRKDAPISTLEVSAFQVPTASPESDGTLKWDSTTLVYVEVRAAGETGIGYTYADVSTAKLIETLLRETIVGRDAFQIGARWDDMYGVTRNLGRGGIVSMAVSAVDVALWDLKAKLLSVPVYVLLGAISDGVPVYGSGGFTAYSEPQLCEQLSGWVNDGIPRVKMKVGRDPHADPERVAAARAAIGAHAELFVDANGAYHAQQAIGLAQKFAEAQVTSGSKSRSIARITPGRALCVNTRRLGWRFPRASTVTDSIHLRRCSQRRRWTCFRRMPRGAAASRGCWPSTGCARAR